MVVVIADLIGLGWLLIFCFKPLVNLRGQTGARNELTQHQDPVYLDNFPELSGLDGYTILLIQQRIGHVEGPWDQDQLPIVLLEDNREGLRHSNIPQALFQGKAGSHRSSLVPEQQGAAGYDKAESHQGGEPRSLQLPPLQWQNWELAFAIWKKFCLTSDGRLYSEKRASKSPGTSGYSLLYISSVTFQLVTMWGQHLLCSRCWHKKQGLAQFIKPVGKLGSFG